MNATVRTRIAPSPTGMFHVGTARTALVNWAFARRHGGEFLLRIEDTDRARHDDDAVRGIFAALAWLGLDFDGTPVIQSERAHDHLAAALRLHDSGHAYWCACTPEEITARCGERGYDGHCARRSLDREPGRLLRFRVPEGMTTTVSDVIRGDATFAHDTISDFGLLRADGSAVFLLANVVDDHAAGITHVIRGEDHLPNTPKYQMLWTALGYGPLPTFAHLSLLVRLGEDGKRPKLSKRRDRVAVEDYRDLGFLPEAMCHYLAGLSYTSIEGGRFDLADYAAHFELGEMLPSPAVFDEDKLRAVNADHLRALDPDAYLDRLRGFAPLPAKLAALAATTQTRAVTLSDALDLVGFACGPVTFDPEALAVVETSPDAPAILDAALTAYAKAPWTAGDLHTVTLTDVCERVDVKLRKAQLPIRVAVTGRRVGPPLFDSVVALERDEVLSRIRTLRDRCIEAQGRSQRGEN